MNATLHQPRWLPHRQRATGTNRRTVRARTAKTTVRQDIDAPSTATTTAPNTNHTSSDSISPARASKSMLDLRRGWTTTPPKASPPTNAAMKPLPPSWIGCAVGEQREGQHPGGAVLRGVPTAPSGEREEEATAEPRAQPDQHADHEVRQGYRRPRCHGAVDLARGGREEEQHERGGDAVVQAALHPQRATDPPGHLGVVGDGSAERGIGGRDRRGDDRCHHGRQVGEDEQGRPDPEGDGEREADHQEPKWDTGIDAQLSGSHGGGVGEQQQGEGDLRQQQQGAAVDADVHHREGRVGEHEAERHERDRRRDAQPFQPRGEQAPQDQSRRDHDEQLEVGTVLHLRPPAPAEQDGPAVVPRTGTGPHG